MSSLKTLAAVAAMAGCLGSANAATVTLSNIFGEWFDAIPAGNVTSNTGGGTANPKIRWNASGYDFDAAASAVGIVPPSPSANFTLGDFTHINQPVASSITSVRLRITADIDVDGTGLGNRAFLFDFMHDETPNGDDPCAYGGANGAGVNVNGCADRVTVLFSDASESFAIGGDLYTINIIGFDSGGGLTSDFLTAELMSNTAALIGNVTLRRDLTVPEPMTSAMVGLGLLGLAASRRRRLS